MRKIPAFCKSLLLCLLNYCVDISRYLTFSQIGRRKLNFEQMCARITASAHVVEKGMSLPIPRLGYGQSKIRGLLRLLNEYNEQSYKLDTFSYTNAEGVLRSYIQFHAERDYDLGEIKSEITSILKTENNDAGFDVIDRKTYCSKARGSFKQCALSRYSVRDFSDEPVDESAVYEALNIARKTPSVCNRQSWHVHWVRDPFSKKQLAELHSGHRGFGDQVDSFLVITANLHSFFGIGERNQCFIDGGLYSMSLLYALHFAGVGACPLNWSMPVSADKKLRSRINIPSSENIIMVIAIGSLEDEFRVAKSVRKSVEDTLTVV